VPLEPLPLTALTPSPPAERGNGSESVSLPLLTADPNGDECPLSGRGLGIGVNEFANSVPNLIDPEQCREQVRIDLCVSTDNVAAENLSALQDMRTF
jgi:hypothetical protein